jgi:hypothetical protein
VQTSCQRKYKHRFARSKRLSEVAATSRQGVRGVASYEHPPTAPRGTSDAASGPDRKAAELNLSAGALTAAGLPGNSQEARAVTILIGSAAVALEVVPLFRLLRGDAA